MGTPKIGIRELVEFVLRAGNLNASMNSQNTAAEGARIHRMLQKQRASHYEKEYTLEKKPLKWRIELLSFTVALMVLFAILTIR